MASAETETTTNSTAPSAAPHDAAFAEFLAEAATAPAEDAAPATEKTEAKEAKAPEGDDATEDAEAEEVEAKADDAEETAGEDDQEAAKLSKQLAAINRAKRRAEAQVAKERAQLVAERQQVEKLREQFGDIAPKVAEFERMRARAAVDPAAALLALGISEDQLEDVARQIYMSSKTAPENLREEGAKQRRLREQESATEKLQRELAEMRTQIESERAAIQQERLVTKFYDGVGQAAEQHPLVAKMLNAEPEEAKAELSKIASALHKAREQITPQRCVELLDARLKARLKALGIDVSDTTKTQTKTGRETKARSLGNDLSTSTRPRPATSSPDDEFARFLDEARSGKLAEG
jgi:DNA repair exonuclease SbcCD ATPase subunit